MLVGYFLLVISVAFCQNITIPSFVAQNFNCVIPGIDPTAQVSTEAYQSRGLVDNCPSLCTTENLFNCTSFTWAGPGTHCILHGKVSQPLLKPLSGSIYNLTDAVCKATGTGATAFKLCSFEDRGVSVAPPSDAKFWLKQSASDCQTACEMDVFTSCSSFGFDFSVSLVEGARNCVTFRRSNTTMEMNSGTFRLYENRCLVKMIACVDKN